jgi:hypothetical protein
MLVEKYEHRPVIPRHQKASTLAHMRIALVALLLTVAGTTQTTERVEVVFSGGHDTDPRDHGRPDVLIAAALGVPTEVFREAFTHVTPARGGAPPEPEQARRNKAALMHALGPYGVTDDRLNEVSNFYRYSRENGDLLWRNTPAAAYASVRDGKVVGFTITAPGAGYSSSPQVSIPGMPNVKTKVTLSFGTDMQSNGSVKEVAALLN